MKNKKTILYIGNYDDVVSGVAIKEYFTSQNKYLTILLSESDCENTAINILQDKLFENLPFTADIYKYYRNTKEKITNRVSKEECEFNLKNLTHKKMYNILTRYTPDVVITNSRNIISPLVVTIKFLKKPISTIVLIDNYIMDYKMLNKNIDKYFVPNREIALELEKFGISNDKISQNSILTKLAFCVPISRSKCREALNIPMDNFVIAVCKDDNRDNYLDKFVRSYNSQPNITVLTLVDDSNDDLAIIFGACDVIITRPIPTTITKALYLDKLLVFFGDNSSLATKLAEYLSSDIAVYAEKIENLHKIIDNMIENPNFYIQKQVLIKESVNLNATNIVCQYIQSILEPTSEQSNIKRNSNDK